MIFCGRCSAHLKRKILFRKAWYYSDKQRYAACIGISVYCRLSCEESAKRSFIGRYRIPRNLLDFGGVFVRKGVRESMFGKGAVYGEQAGSFRLNTLTGNQSIPRTSPQAEWGLRGYIRLSQFCWCCAAISTSSPRGRSASNLFPCGAALIFCLKCPLLNFPLGKVLLILFWRQFPKKPITMGKMSPNNMLMTLTINHKCIKWRIMRYFGMCCLIMSEMS